MLTILTVKERKEMGTQAGLMRPSVLHTLIPTLEHNAAQAIP